MAGMPGEFIHDNRFTKYGFCYWQETELDRGGMMNGPGEKAFVNFLLERFQIERKKFDRSGVYAYTQRLLAYNSNKIEGSTLTEEQTASLFDNGTLPRSDDYYRAKDVEEMSGHFLMFNKMLDTFDEPLTEVLIKRFHYELKSGVFEDRANGYEIGDYRKRPNMIGMYQTARPEKVPEEMERLLEWYHGRKADIAMLAEFHARYECIHAFQDGNGRTGRLILFRDCLKHGMAPAVIEDKNRNAYLEALKEYREHTTTVQLEKLFREEQEFYREKYKYFMQTNSGSTGQSRELKKLKIEQEEPWKEDCGI